VFEVAIGTGRNLDFYPSGVRVTEIDLSPAMLELASPLARELGMEVDLREGDAQELSFPDGAFDTAVCTLSLCNVPDDRKVVAEMKRVLKPGGRLLLLDHVRAASALGRGVQKALEVVMLPLEGEHLLRRPLEHVRAEGFRIEEREQYKRGIVERASARKPEPD
jgi:ubiquinone/menaquinone biosynthesis C-methylase UbiE